MNEVLMGIVVDMMAFLELSGDEVVDPDAAVSCLENISGELQRLDGANRRVFLNHVKKQAAREQDQRRKEFLQSLPEAAGLMEE